MAESTQEQVRDFYPLFPGTGTALKATWADLARKRAAVAINTLQERLGGQRFEAERFHREPGDPKENSQQAGLAVQVAMLAEGLVAMSAEVDELKAQVQQLWQAQGAGSQKRRGS